MLKDVLQSTNTDDNTDASETNLNLEYEENEDGSKLGRLFFTVPFIYFFFFQKISIFALGEVQFWEDGLDCDNQQVFKSSSKGQHQQDKVMRLNSSYWKSYKIGLWSLYP